MIRSHFKTKTIIEQSNSGWQDCISSRMLQIMAHVGEPCLPRSDALYQLEGFSQAHVGGVRGMAQSAGDENFYPLEGVDSFIGHATDIGEIGETSKAKPDDGHLTVIDSEGQDGDIPDGELAGGFEIYQIEIGNAAAGGRRHKAIGKPSAHIGQAGGGAVDAYGMAMNHVERAQVIEAIHVI